MAVTETQRPVSELEPIVEPADGAKTATGLEVVHRAIQRNGEWNDVAGRVRRVMPKQVEVDLTLTRGIANGRPLAGPLALRDPFVDRDGGLRRADSYVERRPRRRIPAGR